MGNSPPKVLVVDDNPVDCELIASLLAGKYTVRSAPDATLGLELFRAERPDFVLLDHNMPGVAGLDALATFAQAGAVVVMITGASTDELAAEAFKRGARDYLLKKYLNRQALERIVAREIERSRLELDLQATQQRFDEVAARIPEVLWMRALDGEFLYLSPAFEQIWGIPRSRMTPESWLAALHPEDTAAERHAVESGRAGREYESEFRIVRPGGEVRYIKNRGYPILDHGELVRFGGVARDVTEEMRMQSELRLAQKLEAIGQLAAGVAHEINTPAQYVSDNIGFLADGFRELVPMLRAFGEALANDSLSPAETERLRALIKTIDLEYLLQEIPAAVEQAGAGMTQITKIVRAMKEFSHPGDDMAPTDLNHIITNTVTVARNAWKYVADVECDFAADLPQVVCLAGQINQVIMNLIVNAADAIAETIAGTTNKGRINIRTRRDGDFALVEIEDTGCGIPQRVIDRIFDPFFTTKAPGKGTGQGLAIARRIIVENHQGSLRVTSEVGQGTRFSIGLPFEPTASLEVAARAAGQRA
jgi:two-component system NtrC family sensor kinase